MWRKIWFKYRFVYDLSNVRVRREVKRGNQSVRQAKLRLKFGSVHPLKRRSENTVKLTGVQVLMTPAMSDHKAPATCRTIDADIRLQLIAQWYPDMSESIPSPRRVSTALHRRISRYDMPQVFSIEHLKVANDFSRIIRCHHYSNLPIFV
jgi:hypothetical protein